MASRKPSEADWSTMLASVEAGLRAMGVPAPLGLAHHVVAMVKRHWTNDGRLQPAYEREAALELIEEAIDSLAGAHLEHAEKLEALEGGQEQISEHLDQIVELLLRVMREGEERSSGVAADNRGAVIQQQVFVQGTANFAGSEAPAPASAPTDPYFEGPSAAMAKPQPHFTGRADELDKLERLVTGDARTVCVVATGIGGIGKTTLAEEFVATRAPELFPDGATWLDGKQLVAELARVAERFGWNAGRAPTPEKAIAYLSQQLHKKCFLVVVDNFDPDEGDCTHVPRRLGPSCQTLVTSRSRSLDVDLDARQLELGVWSPQACRDYLHDCVPRLESAADADLNTLANFVGRLPLGLRLVVALLRKRRSLSPAEALELLEAQPLGVLDKFDEDRGIAKTFQLSWDLTGDDGRRVLQALAVCAKQTTAEVIAAVSGVDGAAEVLDDLDARGFVDFTPGNPPDNPPRWGLHDVVRMFVLEQPGRNEFEAAHLAWVEQHLEAHADPTAHREFSAGAAEALHRFERCAAAGDDAMDRLYYPLYLHFLTVGRLSEAVQVSQVLLQAADADSKRQAAALGNLGVGYETLGDIEKAIDFHERALAINEKLGRLEGQAVNLGNLGFIAAEHGDPEDARDYFTRALELYQRMGFSDDHPHVRMVTENLTELGMA